MVVSREESSGYGWPGKLSSSGYEGYCYRINGAKIVGYKNPQGLLKIRGNTVCGQTLGGRSSSSSSMYGLV